MRRRTFRETVMVISAAAALPNRRRQWEAGLGRVGWRLPSSVP